MQLSPAALSAHLGKGLRSLYTVYGDETLLQLEAADDIRRAAQAQGFTERRVFTAQGNAFDWSDVQNAGQTMGLFGDKQIIEIRIPSGKPGKEGGAALQALAQRCVDDTATLTLVTLPKLDKATQSTGWFGALDSHGVSVKIDSVERAALPAWIAKRLHAQGQRVQEGAQGQQALQFFADRVEGNLLAAHQEVQKLALLFPAGELSFADIESAVLNVARYDVFKLSEAVLGGKALRTQRMLDGLQAEGVAAVLVHWTLAEDIRALARVQAALTSGKILGLALREARVWGVKEKHIERIMGHAPAKTINRLLKNAHEADGVVKGLKHPDWPQDPWLALHQLAQRMVKLSAATTS